MDGGPPGMPNMAFGPRPPFMPPPGMPQGGMPGPMPLMGLNLQPPDGPGNPSKCYHFHMRNGYTVIGLTMYKHHFDLESDWLSVFQWECRDRHHPHRHQVFPDLLFFNTDELPGCSNVCLYRPGNLVMDSPARAALMSSSGI